MFVGVSEVNVEMEVILWYIVLCVLFLWLFKSWFDVKIDKFGLIWSLF